MDRDVNDTDTTSVRQWLAGWGAEVAAVDFDTASGRFDTDVVGFGTKAAVARGLSDLRSEQWQHVWPAIDDFRFHADEADVWVSPDRLQAVIAADWSSTGTAPDGATLTRPGRATVVLVRATAGDPWLGVHTHFSLVPLDPGTALRDD